MVSATVLAVIPIVFTVVSAVIPVVSAVVSAAVTAAQQGREAAGTSNSPVLGSYLE